jgi:alpha-1,2-mannosyltransferase
LALRILVIVRVAGAMYSNIQDCDEVFNFWEPLHFLDHGHGFQTWEVSPVYGIRSWAYVILHLLPARIPALFLGPDKRLAFFTVRIALAVASSLCEIKLYRTVVEKVNERVGRYLFFMLLFSAGMWNASGGMFPFVYLPFSCVHQPQFHSIPAIEFCHVRMHSCVCIWNGAA